MVENTESDLLADSMVLGKCYLTSFAPVCLSVNRENNNRPLVCNLETVFLGRICLKLGSGNLDFGRVPAISRTEKSGCLCLTFLYKR